MKCGHNAWLQRASGFSAGKVRDSLDDASNRPLLESGNTDSDNANANITRTVFPAYKTYSWFSYTYRLFSFVQVAIQN